MISLSLACKLNLSDWNELTLGQIADVILESGKLLGGTSDNKKENNKPAIKRATQDDWDRFGS